MAESRLRDNTTRETTQRKKTWAPASTLPTPENQEGYGFRWIRTSFMGQLDPTNTSARFREGYVPVKAADHPEMMMYSDPNSRFKDNIEVGGLILCKIPLEIIRERDEYYKRQADSQIEAVDNSFMKSNDERMPLFAERKTSTTFGKGSK